MTLYLLIGFVISCVLFYMFTSTFDKRIHEFSVLSIIIAILLILIICTLVWPLVLCVLFFKGDKNDSV